MLDNDRRCRKLLEIPNQVYLLRYSVRIIVAQVGASSALRVAGLRAFIPQGLLWLQGQKKFHVRPAEKLPLGILHNPGIVLQSRDG
jgi:hypothetical protein